MITGCAHDKVHFTSFYYKKNGADFVNLARNNKKSLSIKSIDRNIKAYTRHGSKDSNAVVLTFWKDNDKEAIATYLTGKQARIINKFHGYKDELFKYINSYFTKNDIAAISNEYNYQLIHPNAEEWRYRDHSAVQRFWQI